jgi:predicted amidohydrolase YtcJ
MTSRRRFGQSTFARISSLLLAPALASSLACASKPVQPSAGAALPICEEEPSALAATGDLARQIDERIEMVIVQANVITLASDRPRVQALAAGDGKILAIGTNDEILAIAPKSAQRVDAQGRTIIPGWIEGHGHFMGVGQMKLSLDLREVDSWAQVVQLVHEAAQKAAPGETIVGRGWHQEKWKDHPKELVDGVPTHRALSEAAPDHAVVLTHASGHAVLVNQRALDLSQITRKTKDPEGGTIVRDRRGRPTGYLRETAAGLLKVGAARDEALAQRMIALASEEALAHGITSFHDLGSTFWTIDQLRKAAQSGNLPLRLYVMVRDDIALYPEKLPSYRVIGEGNDHLTVRGIKHAVDGALGSHGAWLLQPYSDLPSSVGLNTTPIEDIESTARLALKHGFQMAVHAIGDRGNREVLDLYARVLGSGARHLDHRWRIEHAQHLHPAELNRFADLGVIAAMQGIHCTSDAPWIEPRLGEQRAREGAYMWRSLWDRKTMIVNGTDAPVESIDPIASYTASVTRMTKAGVPFYPAQAMTREEALRSYTINGAYAAFEEDKKGTLEVGKFADFVVLSQDLLSVPDEDVPHTRVLQTYVGGKLMYEAPPAQDTSPDALQKPVHATPEKPTEEKSVPANP